MRIGSPVRMRGTCFWYHAPLTLCIMQMSLEFSDAELRRLRDHDALVTHVGITTLSDVECQTSMHDMLLKFATLSAQEIPKLKSLASFKMLTFKDLKAAKMALATKEDAEPVLRLAKLMGLIGGNFSGSTLDVFILASQQAGARDFAQVQAVSLPEASPPPPASELAMTAAVPSCVVFHQYQRSYPRGNVQPVGQPDGDPAA